MKRPDNMMESMSALNYLNFSYNKLTILPESMGCMVGLQELDLSHNSIVNIQRGKLKTLLLRNDQASLFATCRAKMGNEWRDSLSPDAQQNVRLDIY